MDPAFDHDVFLSYSSGDRAWAERLHDLLKAERPRCRIFFDRQSLRAGEQWEERIRSSLERAKHLVLLWSPNARESQWVTYEFHTFLALARPKHDLSRRLITLNLEGTNPAAKAFQQIDLADMQRAYIDKAAPDTISWKEAATSVLQGIEPSRRPLSVPLVVLTFTRPELDEQIKSSDWPALSGDFELTDDQLRSRYGQTRELWRPFCDSTPVTEVLETARKEINNDLHSHTITWKTPPDDFWTSIGTARDFEANVFRTGELSALIIDPIALCARNVLQRLMLFQAGLTSHRTVIVTLPPYATSKDVLRLRKALAARAAPYFDDYFQPVVPPRRRLAAQCIWNAADPDDIRRHILLAASHLTLPVESDGAGVTEFLRNG